MRILRLAWRTAVRLACPVGLHHAAYLALSIGVAWLGLFALAVAQQPSSIDWTTAGQGAGQGAGLSAGLPKLQVPAEDPAPPANGFDCRSVTPMPLDRRPIAPRQADGTPARIQRCSRDGFSMEIRGPDQ